jgi:MFS family permease
MNTAFVLLNFGVAAVSPLIGRLLDYVSPRRIMVVSVLLFGASFATLGLSHSVWLSAAVAFAPLAAGLVGCSLLTMPSFVAHWFRRRRGRAMALSVLGGSFGSIVVAPAIGLLIAADGWRAALLIIAGAGTALLLLLAALMRDHPRGSEAEPGDAAAAAPAAASAAPGPPLKIKALLAMKDFWVISVVLALTGAVGQTLAISLVPVALGAHLTRLQATGLVSIFGAAALGGRLLLAVIADKADRVLLTAAICVLGVALNAGFYLSRGWVAYAVCAVVLGATSSTLAPLSAALLADRFGVSSFGTVRGVSAPLISVVSAVAIRFAGEVFDRTGDYRFMFLCFGVAQAVAAVLMISVRHLRGPLQPAPAGAAR